MGPGAAQEDLQLLIHEPGAVSDHSLVLKKLSVRPVVAPFRGGGKIAGGKLIHALVVSDTLAALSFSWTRIIGTVAYSHILLKIRTFHADSPHL